LAICREFAGLSLGPLIRSSSTWDLLPPTEPGSKRRARLQKLLTLRGSRRTISAMGKTRQSKKKVLPTPAELRLLQILWRIGEGTIDDIVKASGGDPPPNYKTVQTLLRIMERKGLVDHEQQGRAFLFRPLVGRGDVHRLSIRHLVAKYFTGSRTELLMELLSDERIAPEELRQLESLIRNRRKEQC